jgi:hypothetical protein
VSVVLLLIFVVGVVTSARSRQDAALRRGDVRSVLAQRWVMAILAVAAALVFLSLLV